MKRNLLLFFLLMNSGTVIAEETLSPLVEGAAPRTFESLWADFDPRAEPLDVEILKEWEEDSVVLKVLRYRVGVFKGQKAMMAAVYGYPEGGDELPGLVQIHGGGQYAHYQACLTNAKRGYATISIAWAGRLSAPGYQVSPDVVKLFWEGKANDPQYKLTTDWAGLDGYHAPSRHKHGFANAAPHEHTLDSVDSSRNDSWFLCTLGARRALTFLEQQPEVDGDRLGVYGHSMGGKLTVMTAGADDRVKAAAPSCGGVSHLEDEHPMIRAMICDDAYLKRITCPIMFLKPANDFHGRIDDLQDALELIQTDEWRVTCSAHHNHQDTPPYEVATQLWMDQVLKGAPELPQTPATVLTLATESGTPSIKVRPDTSRPILGVDVFYTQQGEAEEGVDSRQHTIHRYWHHAPTRKVGEEWVAELPLPGIDKPLWVYANVLYALDEAVSGAGYYYGLYETESFNLSSRMHIVSPEELEQAGVKPGLEPTQLIESFEEDWEMGWFTYRVQEWGRRTHKVYDPIWKAPEGARLAFDVRCEKPNTLVVGIDEYGADVPLESAGEWREVIVAPGDVHDAGGENLADWEAIKELRLVHRETLHKKVGEEQKVLELGADWQGAAPEFRNLRWQ